MNKVTLESGFQSGQSLWRLDLAAVKATRVAIARECTWQGDEDETHEVEFTGPHALKWASFTAMGDTQAAGVEFIDCPAALLDKPVQQPEGGLLYYVEGTCNTTRCVLIETVRDLLTAQIMGETVETFSSTEWVEMPYHWGDQNAAEYWRLRDGHQLEAINGEGDDTPYIDTNGNPRHPSEDADRYYFACQEVTAKMPKAEIESAYHGRRNPLPGLRKTLGGTWVFRRPDAQAPDAVNTAWEEETPFGELWTKWGTVYWIP